jgi:hypothetical protein
MSDDDLAWDDVDDPDAPAHQSRAEELAETLDIPLETAERIAREEGAAEADGDELAADTLWLGGSD